MSIKTLSTHVQSVAEHFLLPPPAKSCRKCSKFNKCESVCQEIEGFINQDNLSFPGWFSLWGDIGSAQRKARNLKLGEMETEFAPTIGNRRPHSKLSDKEWRLLAGAGLSARQEEVLYLYYWQAHSSREVANMLGLHHSAIDALLRRARNRLRRHLHNLFSVEKPGEHIKAYEA